MIVLTIGTFDLLHVGHLELLRECRRLAGSTGTVVAAVNRDQFVDRYKGRSAIQPLAHRLEAVRACRPPCRSQLMPEVIVEHMHPGVDKAEWDDTYRSVFESDRAKRDFEGFTAWVDTGGLAADVAKVRAALGSGA